MLILCGLLTETSIGRLFLATKVPIGTIYKGIYPYIVGMYICLFIFLFFPQISLWLPNLLMK